MDAKSLVLVALAGRTPDEKLAFVCGLLGLDVTAYSHLDNGRKAMTAGNMLRGAINKDPDVAGMVIASAGLSDVDLDSVPIPPQKAKKDPLPRVREVSAPDGPMPEWERRMRSATAVRTASENPGPYLRPAHGVLLSRKVLWAIQDEHAERSK